MAYVERDEVRQELQTLVDESVVTDADLDLWIVDAGRIIDSRLGHLYALPLPDPLPAQAGILVTVARDYVVSRALRKHFSDRQIGEVDAWRSYYQTAMAELNMVVQRDLLSGWLLRPTYGLAVIASAILEDLPSEGEMLLLEYDRVVGRELTDAQLAALEDYPL